MAGNIDVANLQAELDSGNWNEPGIIPIDRDVQLLSVTGIVCIGRCRGKVRSLRRAIDQVPFHRVSCFRTDRPGNGDIMAVGWREP